MKKIIIMIVALVVTGSVFGQTNTPKADSLKQAEINKAVEKIVSTTPIKDLNEFFYRNMTAEKYADFVQAYNIFIERLYLNTKDPKLK